MGEEEERERREREREEVSVSVRWWSIIGRWALIMRRTGMATCIGSGECIDPSIHSTPPFSSLLLHLFFVNFFFFLRAPLVIVNFNL